MDDIRDTLTKLNAAWREHRFDELALFFDENVIMKGPAFKELTRGRQALVQSYVKFMEQSKVTEYAESNHRIERWDNVAAITYDWTMTYEQMGKSSRESGQDMFIFIFRLERWLAALRVMLF